MKNFFRVPILFSIPKQKPHATSTLFLFCRLFSLLTDETQSPFDALLESTLNTEQIFLSSDFSEHTLLLMRITWSETGQE